MMESANFWSFRVTPKPKYMHSHSVISRIHLSEQILFVKQVFAALLRSRSSRAAEAGGSVCSVSCRRLRLSSASSSVAARTPGGGVCAFSPSPRLRANAVSLKRGHAAATVHHEPRREGGEGRRGWERDPTAREYDIYDGGPQSYVIGITHSSPSAICQHGYNAAGVKQSREANGAWLSRCRGCSSRTAHRY